MHSARTSRPDVASEHLENKKTARTHRQRRSVKRVLRTRPSPPNQETLFRSRRLQNTMLIEPKASSATALGSGTTVMLPPLLVK
jgi:hypothetical protein